MHAGIRSLTSFYQIYYKRPDSPPLEPYKQQLQLIRQDSVTRRFLPLLLKRMHRLVLVPFLPLRSLLHGLDMPHVHPMRSLLETPTAAYAMRQHLFSNLYDRLSTRPFLTALEKRWAGLHPFLFN